MGHSNTEHDVRSIRWTAVIALLLAGAVIPDAASAQVTQADSIISMLSAAKRSGVTRAELEATLVEIDKVLASGGYSGALKNMKRAEADLIRHRLAEGDLRAGDVIAVGVASDATVTNNYIVTPARAVIIPSLGTIPVDGILRSEVEAHMQKHIARYLRDPVVMAEAMIRVGIFGGVGQQGYFVVPASLALSDVIMSKAAGLSNNSDLKKSEVRRGDRDIVSADAFTVALREGKSLDQLNMQAGDEIHVGLTTQTTTRRVIAAVSGAASLAFLLTRIF